MNEFLIVTIGGILTASAAMAGNLDVPIVDDASMVLEASQNDWRGFYAGGMIGFNSGDYAYESGAGGAALEGQTFGAFAGYNVQFDAFVLGGELSYAGGSVHDVRPGLEITNYSDVLDIKARAGYSLGSTLVYGFAGYSNATWDNFGNTVTAATGMNYGAGIDILISESMFVGVEYITRDMTSDLGNGNSQIGTLSTFNVRVGVNF